VTDQEWRNLVREARLNQENKRPISAAAARSGNQAHETLLQGWALQEAAEEIGRIFLRKWIRDNNIDIDELGRRMGYNGGGWLSRKLSGSSKLRIGDLNWWLAKAGFRLELAAVRIRPEEPEPSE
jgi:hypothetical protein